MSPPAPERCNFGPHTPRSRVNISPSSTENVPAQQLAGVTPVQVAPELKRYSTEDLFTSWLLVLGGNSMVSILKSPLARLVKET